MDRLLCIRDRRAMNGLFWNVSVVTGAAFSLSALTSFGSRWLAHRAGAIDVPDAGRHQHARPTPQWGGLSIAVAILTVGWASFFLIPFVSSVFSLSALIGYSLAILILLAVGLVDDCRALAPRWLFLGASLAIVSALLFGIHVQRVSHVFGGVWELSRGVSWIVTAAWLLGVTGATKFADGVDGLVTGQVVIGALLIALLSLTHVFFQPGMVIVAGIVGAAFLGFLPFNIAPARQFLGEEGSTIAGFSLGILAILSGAKLAIALMALGIPLMDLARVMLGRLWRGQSLVKGDRTHLHHRLQAAGLSARATVCVIWILSAGFGIAALQLQTQGKVILVALLFLLTCALSVGAEWYAKQRGVT